SSRAGLTVEAGEADREGLAVFGDANAAVMNLHEPALGILGEVHEHVHSIDVEDGGAAGWAVEAEAGLGGARVPFLRQLEQPPRGPAQRLFGGDARGHERIAPARDQAS